MAIFGRAFAQTINHEGHYVNDKKDRGGQTYRGISRKNFPQWEGWEHVDEVVNSYDPSFKITRSKNIDIELKKNLDLHAEVVKFYEHNFWKPLHCKEMAQDVANKLFDIAVNQGLHTAGKYFQTCLNRLNNSGKHYSDIHVDGKIGPKTVTAYKRFEDTYKTSSYRSYRSNINVLVNALRAEQAERYNHIVDMDDSQEKFYYGWLNRL